MDKLKEIIKKINKYKLFVYSLFFLSFLLFILSFYLNSNNNINDEINIERNLEYKVYINNNSYISEQYLTEDKTYISDLIKNIELNIIYNLNSNTNKNLKYSYYVKANIIGEYSDNDVQSKNEVWNKEYILISKKEDIIQNKKLEIAEKIDLDFNKYNEEVINFRKNLKIAISANLELTFNIDILNDIGEMVDNSTIKAIIPLNTVAFKIDSQYDKNTKISNENNIEINYIYLILSIVIFLITVILIIFSNKIRNAFKKYNRSIIDIELEKILKKYNDIIVEINSQVDLNNKQIIEVKSFEEMIDLEEELRIPILLYTQLVEIKKTYVFLILKENIVYRFVLE